MSLFVWYSETDRRYEDVAHPTILLRPRDGALLHDISLPRVSVLPLCSHRSTATDPKMIPDGCDAFLSPVPHLDAVVDRSVELRAARVFGRSVRHA